MSTTARHFSPRASLAALGLRLRRLGVFEAIATHVRVPQKTVKHTPAEKLYDAFLAILSGAHGLSEINTRLRADPTLQRSFGRDTCAEYSLVQDTLDACTAENVAELRLRQYGIVRLLRDVLGVSGFVETDERGMALGVVLNRSSTLARLLAGSLRELLAEQCVAVSLGGLSD